MKVDPDEISVRREKGTDKRSAPEKRRVKSTAEVTGVYVAVGVLFRVEGKSFRGWFDTNGFWCQRDAKGNTRVYRGAPRRVMYEVTKQQRLELDRVRLNARRHGIR